MSKVFNKLFALFLTSFILFNAIAIIPSYAADGENSDVVIMKNVKESIESYNKLSNGKDNVFMSGSVPAISFNNHDYQVFEITIENAGYYSIDIYYGAKGLSYKPKTAIMLFDGSDYVEIARKEIEPTGAYTTFAYQTMCNYAFAEGTYKIKVYQPYADIYFSALRLSKLSDIQTVRDSIESYNSSNGNPDTVSMSGKTPYISFNGGDYQVFNIAVAETGFYKFELKLGALNPNYRAITTIFIHNGTDYVEMDSKLVEPTGAYSSFTNQTVGYYELKAGVNKIKVYEKYADIWFSGLKVTRLPDEFYKTTKKASDYIKTTASLKDDNSLKLSHSSWATYSFDVANEGRYMLFANVSNVESSNVLAAFVDDSLICSRKLDKSINGTYNTQYIGCINLPQGNTEVKIKHTGTMFLTYSMESVFLVRAGDKESNVISGNSFLTVADAYDVSVKNSEFVEGDYLSYDITFSELGTYKVYAVGELNNGSIGVSIDGMNIGKINSEHSVFYFSPEENNKLLKIQILSGDVTIDKLCFEKINVDNNDFKNFLDDVNNAKSVIEMERCILKWQPLFIDDFSECTSGIISLVGVYTKMCEKNYDSVDEIITDFNELVYNEKIIPTVTLLKDNDVIYSLENGDLSLKIKTDTLGESTSVIGAVYEDNKLSLVGEKTYSGNDECIILPLGQLNKSIDKNYKLKVLFFDGLDKIKPAENFNNVYKSFYVSVKGDDNNAGTETAPFKTLEKALNVAKDYTNDMTGDILINLESGDYHISESIKITSDYSGKNGYNVIIKGDDNQETVINGGEKIEDWAYFENGIYRAKYEPDQDVRNLYVNGFPAIRAKSEYGFRCVELFGDDNSENVGVTVKDEYFPTSFARPDDLELVWELVWEAQRTPVSSITYEDNIAFVSINPQIYARNNPSSTTGFGPNKIFYLENAYELLDKPGEFYYNSSDGYIYYYPTENEELSECDIFVGVSQGLVSVEGSSIDDKVKNIKFENLSFRYGVWENVTQNGFLGRQADSVLDTVNGSGEYMIPAQFTVNYADNISIRNCEFTCLGSSALAYKNSVTNSEIIGNKFVDVSGTGITIGSFHHENNLSLSCENIQIKNNLIKRVGIEYRCCAGISFYYDAGVEICHNTLVNLPYTAISGGWGWGATECGRAGNNRVCHNFIENVMSSLSDGGGIYLLGTQNNTVITENYINKVNRRNASLYSDNGSAFIYFYKNLCTNSVRFATASPGGHSNHYINNYTDTDFIYEEYPSDISDYLTVKDNIIIEADNLPDEALTIKESSGILDNYAFLLANTDIPLNKKSIICDTPKRTFTIGAIYEAETYKAISDAGAGVVVYSNCLGISNTQWADFEIEVDKAGIYDFGVYYSIGNATGATIQVLVNDTFQKSGTVNSTGNWSTYTNKQIGEINLPEGNVKLRVRCTKGSFQLDCFTLNYLREN